MSAQQSFWSLAKNFFVSATPVESTIPSVTDKSDKKFGGSRRVSSPPADRQTPNCHFIYAYGSLNLP